jgi:hypothetical protein
MESDCGPAETRRSLEDHDFCEPKMRLESPFKSASIDGESASLIGRYFPVATASKVPEEFRNSAFASKILSRRFTTNSAMATVWSPGRAGLRKRTPSSAQNAKRRVATAQAQTMVSSKIVAIRPPWTVSLKPTCCDPGTNCVCTTRPSVLNLSLRPLTLESPQTKQE